MSEGANKLRWVWMVVGMFVGALVGWALQTAIPAEQLGGNFLYQSIDGIATIFLRLLKLIVVPLVFFSLLAGMIHMGDMRRLGRLGGKTFLLYLTTSALAVVTGLGMVNIIRPGVGSELVIPTEGVDKPVPEGPWDVLVNMVPSNFIEAAAKTDLIGVILFTLMFGAFMLTLQGKHREHLFGSVEAIAEVMMRVTGFVISLAPLGVGALIARLVADTGLGTFQKMVPYVITVFLALAFHATVVLPLLVRIRTGRNPYRFMFQMLPAYLTGLSTASSSGTLGVTMKRAEEDAGISNRVSSFVLPLGATVNMDGTALYEIVTVLFIAQIHSAVDPSFSIGIGQQLLIVFLGLAVSVGAAGIPHAGLVMMVIILEAVGLPTEYTALIWAVDRPLDMLRTAVNIVSDSCVTLMVAHSEGEVAG